MNESWLKNLVISRDRSLSIALPSTRITTASSVSVSEKKKEETTTERDIESQAALMVAVRANGKQRVRENPFPVSERPDFSIH